MTGLTIGPADRNRLAGPFLLRPYNLLDWDAYHQYGCLARGVYICVRSEILEMRAE